MVETAGGEVVRRELAMASEQEAQRLVEHLRRLITLSDPHLVPVGMAAREGNRVSVLFEPGPGRSLRELLDRTPRSPGQAAAVGLKVLAGLASLQRAGLAHGALNEDNVHVGPEGRVRLLGYGMRPRFRPGAERPAWPDPRNDLTAAGRLLCEMLGVPLAPAPRQPLRDAERLVPALVAAARALAAGGSRNASAAIASIGSAAGSLAAPVQVRHQLALLAAEARARQPAPVPLPRTPVPASELRSAGGRPPVPGPRPRARGLAGACVLALLLGVGLLVASLIQTAAPRGSGGPPRTVAIAPAGPADAAPAPDAEPDADADTIEDLPSAPTPLEEDSPVGAVSDFYRLIRQHHYAAAIQLWTARMRVAYPPDQNVTQRFAGTSSLRLIRAEVSSQGPARAVVTIELEEVRDARTYRWVGSWSVVRESTGWRLDRPALSSA
jgi:hypothetical protein